MCRLIVPLATLILINLPTTFFADAQQRRASAASSYALSKIDLNSNKLPTRCQGVDPQLIYDALDKRSKEAAKGEFETTAAYKARIEGLQHERLMGEFGLDGLIPVAVTSELVFDRLKSSYDADTENLLVTIEARPPVIGVSVESDRRWLPSKYDFQPTASYVGVNAYGARVTVEKTVADIYGVLLQNIAAYSLDPPQPYAYSSSIVTRFRLESSDAKEAKNNLRALLFLRLEEPFITHGYISSKPTISNPKETFAAYYYLIGHAEQIWIYNYETGVIYRKLIPRSSAR